VVTGGSRGIGRSAVINWRHAASLIADDMAWVNGERIEASGGVKL
jgi:hypothetical protein